MIKHFSIFFVTLSISFNLFASNYSKVDEIEKNNFDVSVLTKNRDILKNAVAKVDESLKINKEEWIADVQKRLDYNKASLEIHSDILEDLEGDLLINSADTLTTLVLFVSGIRMFGGAEAYLRYYKYQGPLFLSGYSYDSLIGPALRIGGFATLLLSNLYAIDKLNANWDEKDFLEYKVKGPMTKADKSALIQILNNIILEIDKDFSTKGSWYHNLTRSHAPFEKRVAARMLQVKIDALLLDLLDGLF